MNKFATFELVTDAAVIGDYNGLRLLADKLTAKRDGMEVWELKWVLDGVLLNKQVVKCTPGDGAGEARAVMEEAAPYWLRRGQEAKAAYAAAPSRPKRLGGRR